MNRFYELRNIAVGKVTDQSSTYGSFFSSYANDGIENSLSVTRYDLNPYWRVDLNRTAVVLYVIVSNRGDGVARWINPFDIRVGHTTINGGVSNPLCVAGATLPPKGGIKNFTCPETEGRYASIHLPRKQYLRLFEVEVYGIYL